MSEQEMLTAFIIYNNGPAMSDSPELFSCRSITAFQSGTLKLFAWDKVNKI